MDKSFILAINAGSSSVKFSLYERGETLKKRLQGKIDRIGLPGSVLIFAEGDTAQESRVEMDIKTHEVAKKILLTFFAEHIDFDNVSAVGHRIVQGMNRSEHVLITEALISELKRVIPLDPEHLPQEIALIELFKSKYPNLTQVACFDTVFHHDMPRVAKTLPLPRHFRSFGIARYGFHGLSYSYLMNELGRIDPQAKAGRVIIAHLGNGASIAAISGAKSVDTSMGFSPAGGIPMGSRTGDIDPGALLYAMQSEGLSISEAIKMVNHKSGLIGISETSGDMHDLLGEEASDNRAKEAVDYFCYETKKQIGAYAAALGGIETLIFSGGMGENAPNIRARICEGLQFLGITLDKEKNGIGADIISTQDSRVTVRVIHTDEEFMIASIANAFITK